MTTENTEVQAAPDMGIELEAVQAQQLKTLGPTDYALRKLRKDYAEEGMPANVVKGTDDYTRVHDAAMLIRSIRTNIEHKRKELKAGALKWGNMVDAEAKRLTQLVVEVEAPWKLAKLEADQAQAKKEQEEREAEERRIAAIEAKVVGLKAAADGMLNASAEQIKARLDKVKGIVVTEDDYAEYYDAAVHHQENAITALNGAHGAKVQQEEMAAQIEEQKRMLEEQQARIDAQQAETDRLEQERLAEEVQAIVDSEKLKLSDVATDHDLQQYKPEGKAGTDLDDRPAEQQRADEEALVPKGEEWQPVDNTQQAMDETVSHNPTKFEQWWIMEGSLIDKRANETGFEFVERIAFEAWTAATE